MKRLLSILVLLTTFASASCDPTTRVPFTYAADYTLGQSASPEFRETRFRDCPPDLYHCGSDLRYLARYGYGAVVTDSRFVPYEDFVSEVRSYVADLHGKGIRWTIPYLCPQTLSGEDWNGFGAWEAYANWDRFQALGLGPKPSEPLSWMQREPSGNLHYNYKRCCFYERSGTPNMIRYAPCLNNPDWRRICDNEARLAAELGFDGMFMDNCILHCYCQQCQRRFQDYLKEKYSPEQLQKAFGVQAYSDITLFATGDHQYWARSHEDFIPWLEAKYPPEERRITFDTAGPLDPVHVDNAGGGELTGETAAYIRTRLIPPERHPSWEAIRLANPALQTPEGRLRWAETMMFWADSVGEMLQEVRDAGRKVDPDFFLVPNWGTMQRVQAASGRAEEGHDMRRWKRGGDLQMFEEDHTTGLLAPGVVLDYDVELRYAFAAGVQAVVLPHSFASPDLVRIAIAEAAAVGGSVYENRFRDAEAVNTYRRFFQTHSDLYEGYHSAAKVALAHFFDQVYYYNVEHLRQVHALNRYLADQQIPFDQITEDDLQPERMSQYRIVILPNVAFLSDEQIAAVSDFIAGGGAVATIGEYGTHDLYCREREATEDPIGRLSTKGDVTVFSSLAEVLPHPGVFLEPAIQAARSGFFAEEAPGEEQLRRHRAIARIDEALGIKRYQEPGPLTPVIERALRVDPHLIDPWQASGIRSTVYRKDDGQGERVVIHLVNKNVPVTVPEEERVLRPVKDLHVRLPLPHGVAPQSVEVYVPGKEPQHLAVAGAEGGHPEVLLDRLDDYAVISVPVGR